MVEETKLGSPFGSTEKSRKAHEKAAQQDTQRKLERRRFGRLPAPKLKDMQLVHRYMFNTPSKQSPRTISQNTPLSRAASESALKALVRNGIVTKRGGRYRLTDEGKRQAEHQKLKEALEKTTPEGYRRAE